jgi:CPA2 family monovalent cation:H+ antiporter-2
VETSALLIELGGVLLVLTVGARLSSRVGLSPIPLYLLVGLALGRGGVYPLVTAEGFIEVGAEIGVVLLLLMLGLEYSPRELTAGLRSGGRLAVADFVLNFTPGFAAAMVLGWGHQVALVLGGVTYISSSGIAAKLIEDLGWLANAETPHVLSLLVAEDLVMAVYLPLLSAVLAGGTVWTVTTSVAGALVVAGLTLAAAIRFGPTISRLLQSTTREGLILGILGLTLVVAGVAERLHISAAVGAFLVGIAVSGRIREEIRTVLQPMRDVFAAIFFVLFGLQVDPRNIPSVLALAVALAVVTAVTKTVAVDWGLRHAGLGRRARRRAIGTLISRGEFSIIIAEIGVAAGLRGTIGPLATAYVLVLAVVGPLAARAARTRPPR